MSINELYAEFQYRKSVIDNVVWDEFKPRITGFYQWLVSQEIIKTIIDKLRDNVDLDKILEEATYNQPPKASTPDEIAAVGLFFMSRIAEGIEVYNLTNQYGIHSPYSSNSIQDEADELIRRFIEPAIEFVDRELEQKREPEDKILFAPSEVISNLNYPPEITHSLEKFKQDHSNYDRNAFIMMRFGKTKAHNLITSSIRSTLEAFGIEALRADDKEYHDDLFGNVLTYIYGCRFGIAVFERLEAEDFNPNVSLEVGYMRALRKPICLLKDQTLKTLQTDLVGKLYKSFDSQAPDETIPSELEKWLRDKEIVIT